MIAFILTLLGRVYDLPAGGRRIVQRASGYVATIVSGHVTYREGVPTDALPGRMVRAPAILPDPMRSVA